MPESGPSVVDLLLGHDSSRELSAKASLHAVMFRMVQTTRTPEDFARWSFTESRFVCFNDRRQDEQQFLIAARKGGFDVLWRLPGGIQESILISFEHHELAELFREMDVFGITAHMLNEKN